MSAVLAADAFFARIVPYRTIVSVAVPPEYARAAAVRAAVGVGAAQQSTHGEDATSKDASSSPAPCANCIGLASSNAYLNLSHPLGVVMVRRERGFPYEGVARRVARHSFARYAHRDGVKGRRRGRSLRVSTRKRVRVVIRIV